MRELRLAGLALALALARPAAAATGAVEPYWPYITASFTQTGMASASISGTVWAFGQTGSLPLSQWSLSVKATTTAALAQWIVDLEASNDLLTWTSILQHKSGTAASPNGQMVWGPHKRARAFRLKANLIAAGTTVGVTGYGEP